MRKKYALSLLCRTAGTGLLCLLLALNCVAAAEDERPEELKYRPPKRGAPKVRVAGGSRGPEGRLPSLYVLAPDHVGLTAQAAPRLYWYQGHATDLPIAFSLSRAGAVFPELEFTVTGSRLRGQVCVDLAEFGVSLETGVEYRWIVAIVPDPAARSRDVIAEARIERTDPGPKLASELEGAGPAERAAAYARAGVWYDALATVNDLVEGRPEDLQWRRWRGDLLAGVDLAEPAEALGEDPAGAASAQKTESAAADEPGGAAAEYEPARRGAPSRLVSSASREGSRQPAGEAGAAGAPGRAVGEERVARSEDGQTIAVLLPPEGGTTAREQPTLFWFASREPAAGVHLQLGPADAAQPLCEVMIRAFDGAGIQRLDLASLGLGLKTGTIYEWRASLLSERPDGEPGLVAHGLVKRVSAPAGALAWCDALAQLSEMIAANPEDPEPRRQRARLLREAGLHDAADRDTKRLGD